VTLEELEASLPNGLHDSFLLKLDLDYVTRTARLKLDIWVGDLGAAAEPARERRRAAIVELSGLQFCAIEPPDATYPFTTLPWIDVEETTVGPAGFESSLFVTQWNSRIRIAALDATLQWLDEADSVDH